MEAHSPATELFSKHPILLAKIFNDLQLTVVHPPGDGDQQKSEWVERSLRIQDPIIKTTEPQISHLHADPVFGPYAVLPRGHDRSRAWAPFKLLFFLSAATAVAATARGRIRVPARIAAALSRSDLVPQRVGHPVQIVHHLAVAQGQL